MFVAAVKKRLEKIRFLHCPVSGFRFPPCPRTSFKRSDGAARTFAARRRNAGMTSRSTSSRTVTNCASALSLIRAIAASSRGSISTTPAFS